MSDYSLGDEEFMKRIFGYRFKNMSNMSIKSCFGVHVLYCRDTDVEKLEINDYKIVKYAVFTQSSMMLTIKRHKKYF